MLPARMSSPKICICISITTNAENVIRLVSCITHKWSNSIEPLKRNHRAGGKQLTRFNGARFDTSDETIKYVTT